MTYDQTFARVVFEAVMTNVAAESVAQAPLGLCNRPYDTINEVLIMNHWSRLASGPGTVAQHVARICGMEQVCPQSAGNAARTFTLAQR